MAENIVIVGASEQAKVVIDIIEKAGKYRIIGLVDRAYVPDKTVSGYPLLGREEELPALHEAHTLGALVIAIGDNAVRAAVAEKLQNLIPEVPFVTAVHPTAVIGTGVVIGEGSVVMAGAVVNPDSRVGRHCIINTKASLDHDGVMEDFASLAPGVVTGGMCRIGAYTAVGIGAILLHGIRIGAHSVIGGGALVNKTLGDNVVAYGSPARVVRARKAGEKYL